MNLPFFTLADEQIKPKGSRDPMGFQQVRSSCGRRLVANFNTVSAAVEPFATLIVGTHLARIHAEDKWQDERALVDAFLRFERLAAYPRFILEGL